MKIIYNSYGEVLNFAREAMKSLTFGLCRTLWVIVLLVANATIFAYRKAATGIKRYPMVAVATLLLALVASNLANYASMKAKLTTAQWKCDRLEMRMDSVYEVFNIEHD